MTNQSKSYYFALATILMWSTASTAFKIALNADHTLPILTYSMLTASAILFIYCIITKEIKKLFSIPINNWKMLLFLTIILYLYHIVLFLGYAGLPVQIALPVNYFWTVLLAFFGAIFLKQKLSPKEIFWLFFSFSGIILISLTSKNSGFNITYEALFYIILSAILYPLYWIFTTKDQTPAMLKICICFLGCTFLGFINLAFLNMAFTLTPNAIFPTLYIGLFELSIPFICWYYAMTYTNSISKIATIPLCSPFISLIWAYLFLDEQIAPINLIGLCIIIFGTFMQQKQQKAK